MTTSVIHVRKMQEGDVYIGHTVGRRKNLGWGNPFRMDNEGERQAVIDQYREWIQGQPELLARLPELKGKRLACFCAPKPCHGDVLAELAEATDGR